MKAGSLRVRVTLWYVGLLAVALVAFGAAVYLGLEGYLENSLQHSLMGQANGIATQFVAEEESKGSAWMVQEVVESYAPESSGRFIRITRSDGFVLYASGNSRDPLIHASLVPRPILRRKRRRSAEKPLIVPPVSSSIPFPMSPAPVPAFSSRRGHRGIVSITCCGACFSPCFCSLRSSWWARP